MNRRYLRVLRNLSLAVFATVLLLVPRRAFAVDLTNCSVSYWSCVCGNDFDCPPLENDPGLLYSEISGSCNTLCANIVYWSGGYLSSWSPYQDPVSGAWGASGSCQCY